MTTTTETAIMSKLRDSAREHALHHLLRRLREYARAVPYNRDDQMPEHRIEWFVDVDGGSDAVIGAAMKEVPALWMGALPDGVSIVPTKDLERLVPSAAAYLAEAGSNMVLNQAARLQRESIEDAARMSRGGK